jgi:serine protein kinase
MDNNTEFENIIKKDRDNNQSRSWQGKLLGYLDKIKEDPSIAKLAHARLYDVIVKAGVRDLQESTDPHVKRLYKDESIKIYDFFTDEFFGIEKTVAQIVRYFHAASLKGEESRQVLYLMGPVGSGKSSLAEKLHRGLEESDPFRHRGLPDVRGAVALDTAPFEKRIRKNVGSSH